jgi:hypothetical protein
MIYFPNFLGNPKIVISHSFFLQSFWESHLDIPFPYPKNIPIYTFNKTPGTPRKTFGDYPFFLSFLHKNVFA